MHRRRVIDEPSHRLQAPVTGDDGEIGAAGEKRSALRSEFPREADAAVNGVEFAGLVAAPRRALKH